MRYIFLLILTITSLSVTSQTHQVGIKGGENWSNMISRNVLPVKSYSRKGIAVGITYDYILKKYYSTGVDIIFNQRGFSINGVKFNYDYLAFPLKIGFNYGRKVYGFTNIGFTTSIILKAIAIEPDHYEFGQLIHGRSYNDTNEVNKFDFGGLIEIGCGYKFKERYWVFSSFSFDNSFKVISYPSYFEYNKIKHYSRTLNLGLKCTLGKK
jgi:hypothetical protein